MKTFRSRVAAASVATAVVLGACGMARAQTPAAVDGPSFEITPHHTGISVPNLEESVAWYQRMLGFEVADARAAAAALKAKGAEVVMGPVENMTEIFFFVRDNSGNAFELI